MQTASGVCGQVLCADWLCVRTGAECRLLVVCVDRCFVRTAGAVCGLALCADWC